MLPEPLREVLQRSSEHLSDGQKEGVASLLARHKHVFALTDHDLGTTRLVQNKMNTGETPPIRQQPRRTSPWKHAEIEQQVTTLLQQGRVKESSSPRSSPAVLVIKKDGSQRFCADYRQLNAATVKDAYPLPRADNFLDAQAGWEWFSTLDLASGYWHVTMDPTTQEKAAFVTSSGLYE